MLHPAWRIVFAGFLLGAGNRVQAEQEALPGLDTIPVCYNYSCAVKDNVGLSAQEWRGVANWFIPKAQNPEQERQQIKQAIGWLEVLVGRHTPTHNDKGQNNHDVWPGQMDCIDESINTTTYLNLLVRQGLIQHHNVVDRALRRAVFDQHWAAQIEEKHSGNRWVVDSWFQDNGYLPYVQETSQWKDIPFMFTSFVDNSPD